MRSARQKVDQANSSLLEYKNFFLNEFWKLGPRQSDRKVYREKLKD